MVTGPVGGWAAPIENTKKEEAPEWDAATEANQDWRRIDRFKESDYDLGVVLESYFRGYYLRFSDDQRSLLLGYLLTYADQVEWGRNFIPAIMQLFERIANEARQAAAMRGEAGSMINEAPVVVQGCGIVNRAGQNTTGNASGCLIESDYAQTLFNRGENIFMASQGVEEEQEGSLNEILEADWENVYALRLDGPNNGGDFLSFCRCRSAYSCLWVKSGRLLCL